MALVLSLSLIILGLAEFDLLSHNSSTGSDDILLVEGVSGTLNLLPASEPLNWRSQCSSGRLLLLPRRRCCCCWWWSLLIDLWPPPAAVVELLSAGMVLLERHDTAARLAASQLLGGKLW